ncbi:hypothetical protein SDRG_14579 [Saprolegnia diclina VS20]|uniref:Uncharacterized protein n=1 Tax=Saprolegnia diclina (strain VS20) TaxID=1156394 RepID=T0PZI2_SAPDV|nr:hypothetical protein SDRG_14579 [Saprolegnia diclina VS20]EQC27671.1 hypothetical protein SDRG_14579 [Saprolegnia diclina VS20]|eukprot:XP_008618939.1 hypothetical protein SDRG_14579 [Saprolegnia diclina VS20]
MRVQPAPPHELRSRHQRASMLLGMTWLCMTLAGSVYYLFLLQPPLANNLLWPHFNASGYQAFLIDILNALLETAPDGSTVDLHLVMLEARYSSLLATAVVHPTYAMALASAKLTTLPGAIARLRNTSVDDNLMAQPTQYCWVDFNKAFELAHTAARQQRCLAQYAANGAVYLESVLRNTDRHAFAAAYHTPGSNYEIAILRGLEGTVAGVEWLDAIASVATSVDEEVAYWQRHGIGAFRYQWHNLFLPGLVETVTLRNVFGLETSVILKSTVESQGPWTTVVFSPPFVLDLLFAGHCNASLIRGTPDDILNTWCDGQSPRPFESFIGLSPYERHIGVVRDTLGPFLAIDLYIVPVLSPVGALATDLISAFHDTLNASSAALYSALDGALVVTPVPPAWPSAVHIDRRLHPIVAVDRPHTAALFGSCSGTGQRLD